MLFSGVVNRLTFRPFKMSSCTPSFFFFDLISSAFLSSTTTTTTTTTKKSKEREGEIKYNSRFTCWSRRGSRRETVAVIVFVPVAYGLLLILFNERLPALRHHFFVLFLVLSVLFSRERARVTQGNGWLTTDINLKYCRTDVFLFLSFYFYLKCSVAPEQVQRFHGNHSHPDHFKLLETNGDSILVGARYVFYFFLFLCLVF